MSDTTRLDLERIMAQAAECLPRAEEHAQQIDALLEANRQERKRWARERSDAGEQATANPADADAGCAFRQATKQLGASDEERSRLEREQVDAWAQRRQLRFLSGYGRDLALAENQHTHGAFTAACRDGGGHSLDLSISSDRGWKAGRLSCVRCAVTRDLPMLDAALLLLALCRHLGLVSDLDQVQLFPVLPS
jgi:hypothetical protein